jgi:hypothetical protein
MLRQKKNDMVYMDKGERKILKVHLSAVFLILIVSLIACYGLLSTKGVILYGDFTFPQSLERFFDMHFPLWNQYGSIDSFQYIPRLTFQTIPILFGFLLSVQIEVFYKLFLLGTMVISGLSMYVSFIFLTQNFYKKRIGIISLIVAIIYMLNFKALHTIIWPTLHFAYALAPITLVSFIKFTSLPKIKYALSVVFLMTLTAGSPHYLFFMMMLMGFWFTYYTITQKFTNINRQLIKLLSLSMLLFILINSFWLLPFVYSIIFSTVPGPNYIITLESIDMLSRNSGLADTTRLVDIWWQHSSIMPENGLVKNIWLLSSFFIPILSFTSLIFSKKEYKKYSKFFFVISILIIFISTGTNNAFSRIYTWLTLNLPFGWLLRAPNKLTMILAMIYSFSCGITLLSVFNNNWKKTVIITVTSLILFSVSILPMANGHLYGIFTPVRIPKEYDMTNNYISGLQDYNVLWLPLTYSGNVSWAPEKLVGPLDVRSSSMPNIASFNLQSKNYLEYIFEVLLENKSNNIHKLLTVLNVKYIVFHNDTSEHKQYNISKLLEMQNDIKLQEKYGFIYIFENPNYVNKTNILGTNIFITGGLNKFASINALSTFNPLNSSLYFLDQGHHDTFNPASIKEAVIVNQNPQNLAWLSCVKKYLAIPFDATNHHNPSKFWSKAMTSNPLHGDWHPYLKELEIENWDFDYGEGLVFTGMSSTLEKPAPNENELMVQWTFDSTTDIDQWKNYTSKNQFGALYSITSENDALKAELMNSTSGWKTINSPLTQAEYGNWYQWLFKIKGENTHETHIKIIEYNEEKKILETNYIKNTGSGTFNWEKIRLYFTPNNPSTKYTQLQIWHGHDTTQPLPNKILLDNVEKYNLRRFVKPVTLEIPLEAREPGEFVFLTRLFENQHGGSIMIQIEDNNYTINTKNQINKFVWKEVDTIDLEKGSYIVNLTNVEGFNAVNLFVLISKQEYQSAINQQEQILQDNRVIYILEAESDLYYKNATISNQYGGKASNGKILELIYPSKAWIEVEILKQSNYTIAIRNKGSINILIDEKEYTSNSTQLNWTYIGPINLKKGKYNVELKPSFIDQRMNDPSQLDVIWFYSTKNLNETIEDVFTIDEKPAEITMYQKIDSTKYKIEANATKPFMLTFAESYDQLWSAYVNQEKINSVQLYSVINGFWINHTGKLEITVEYDPQQWFYYGSIVSTICILGSILFLIYNWKKKSYKYSTIKKMIFWLKNRLFIS